MRHNASRDPIVHAGQVCTDPDCELHNPDVAREEEVIDDWQYAYYLVGLNKYQDANDPYGSAVNMIRRTLEWALDDGVSGAMNSHEWNNLDALAKTLASLDPAAAPNPRAA